MTAENENEAWVAPRATSKLAQLPLVGLLRTYRREWIGGDLRGGISASLVMIPSVIAYAELANLRPEYGLYAALMAMLGYALFASSRQVIAGPDAALTLLGPVPWGRSPAATRRARRLSRRRQRCWVAG